MALEHNNKLQARPSMKRGSYEFKTGEHSDAFKQYLRDRGIAFEPSSNGNMTHFELFNDDDAIARFSEAIRTGKNTITPIVPRDEEYDEDYERSWGTRRDENEDEDLLDNEHLAALFKQYKGDENKVIDVLRKKGVNINNSDLQSVVEAFATRKLK